MGDPAQIESLICLIRNDLAFGTDMARVKLQPCPGSAIIICVDTKARNGEMKSPNPRILVTLLLLNDETTIKHDVKTHSAYWQENHTECCMNELFEKLPKVWSKHQLKCFMECVSMTG
jgi:hypothetical protein